LTSVIKKLGASNRQHAVAKAVMYGLVRPKP
jgi:LuxR family transcriptional regulator, transcriptional activator of the bioluminescence operon